MEDAQPLRWCADDEAICGPSAEGMMHLGSVVPLAAAARVLREANVGVGVGAKAGAGGVGVGANAKAGGKHFKHKKAGGKGASPAPPPSAVDCGDNSDPCVGGGGVGNGGGYYDYADYP
ncbi:hypothetical protein ACQJBY_063599 [Aegilops geniculata]